MGACLLQVVHRSLLLQPERVPLRLRLHLRLRLRLRLRLSHLRHTSVECITRAAVLHRELKLTLITRLRGHAII